MGEQNPLQITPAPNGNTNPKGRPRKTQSIKFSTQPRSIVSQLLQKMITENKIIIPIEWNSEGTAVDSTPIVEYIDKNFTDFIPVEEADQSEENVAQTPKKQYIHKRMGKMEPKIYSCDFSNCIYNTKLSSNLQKHKRTHTGEKPYLCDRCSFQTNFSNSLRVHKRLHTTERPYPCTECDYRCNSISNLKKHCHTKHKHINNLNDNTQLSK